MMMMMINEKGNLGLGYYIRNFAKWSLQVILFSPRTQNKDRRCNKYLTFPKTYKINHEK